MSIEKKEQLLSEMNEVLKHEIAQRHSYFQLKYFVIGKEPTLQSKMWQCLRELKSRRESLEAIELELENSKDKLELLDIEIEKINLVSPTCKNAQTRLQAKENAIKIRQIERQKKATNVSLMEMLERKKWIEDESRFFLETFKNFEKIEPLKNFDDIDCQKEYWGEKLTQKLNLKMLTHNQLDVEMVETIIALPDDMPIKKQTLGTLQLRHVNMINQLKSTMSHIETVENKEGE